MRQFLGMILCAAMIHGAFAQQVPPDDLVKHATADVLKSVKGDEDIRAGDTARAIKVLDAQALQYFDFDRMTALAVGKAWRQATVGQKVALTAEFRTLLVRTYAAALTAYDNQKISVLPVTTTGAETEVTVQTEIERAGARPIAIDYDLEQAGATWKVYDVSIEGISLVVNFRSQFAEAVRREGIDGLIKALRAKNGGPVTTSSHAIQN